MYTQENIFDAFDHEQIYFVLDCFDDLELESFFLYVAGYPQKYIDFLRLVSADRQNIKLSMLKSCIRATHIPGAMDRCNELKRNKELTFNGVTTYLRD